MSEWVPSDDLKNGEIVDYYSNGDIETEGTYKDGVLDGLYRTWYPSFGRYKNGQPFQKMMSECSYKDGKLDGLDRSWYATGIKCSEGTYKDGKPVGKRTSYNEDGSVNIVIEEDGSVIEY